MMTYEEIMNYITHTDWKGSSLGLKRMQDIMQALGNPQDKLAIIHVAGTNGKGSCCAMLQSILMESGYKVGMYTSPHLVDYEERFNINGVNISKNALIKIGQKVKKVTDKMTDQPTEFEILTAMSYLYFYEEKVDVAVMEVGLGGRLDATNIVSKPDLCVIMNIGLEHTEILGDSISKIAYEKAGIIKNDSDVVVYQSDSDALEVFKQVAKERNARLHISSFDKVNILKQGLNGQLFDYKKYHNIKLSLLGIHQFYNAATVLECCEILKKKNYQISLKSIRKGLENTKWPARLSLLSEEPLFILDGGHNPQCANALKESLPALLGKEKAIILCGMLKDKDYQSTMKMIMPFAKEFVCLTPFSKRSLSAEDLATYLRSEKQIATAANTVEEGIMLSLQKAGKKGIVVCFGSLYLAGYIADSFKDVYKKWSEDN